MSAHHSRRFACNTHWYVEKSAEFKAHFWPCARGWAIGVHERTGILKSLTGAKIIEARRADDFRPGIFSDTDWRGFRIQNTADFAGNCETKDANGTVQRRKLRCEEERASKSSRVEIVEQQRVSLRIYDSTWRGRREWQQRNN